MDVPALPSAASNIRRKYGALAKLVHLSKENIRIQGYSVSERMRKQTFAGTILLLHQGRLPTEGEKRLLDAIFIGASDHGPGASSATAARLASSSNRCWCSGDQ
jgi:citrate synthase